MATYSQSVFGIFASSPFTAKVIEVNDANAAVGAQQNAMQTGTQILCKRPDGSTGYYTIDAERYVPGQPPFLRPV